MTGDLLSAAGMGEQTGWIWTDGHIVGNLDRWETAYHWNGALHRTQQLAIKVGLREYGSDDFNVAHVVNGEVVWWGWMDEPHPIEDAGEFAEQHGFTVAAVSS